MPLCELHGVEGIRSPAIAVVDVRCQSSHQISGIFLFEFGAEREEKLNQEKLLKCSSGQQYCFYLF